MSGYDFQKNIKEPTEPIGEGLLKTTVAATAAGIFLGLRAVGVGQPSAIFTSTSLVCFMSLPI